MKKLILLFTTAALALGTQAADLVPGGQFKDRILPMQGSQTNATWGAPGVQGRFTDNGVERNDMNIWGGNVIKESDGKYHQFVAGWSSVNRAFNYWSNSHIYHFTSSTSYGPFTNPVDIGQGHNPEIFVAKDGTFVVYALIGNKAAYRHTCSTLGGTWSYEEMPSNLRDRALSTGSTTTYSNWTFARRQDGSQYCMDRGGAVWISETGLSSFDQVLGNSCYPNGGGGTFEDPVVWRDEVQYHMIVNDWNARKAYYSRSADGFHWVAEDGLAYDTEVSVHPDGTREEWYKYERPRVFQDEFGRAIQLNMAVVDTIKAQDLANDNHSSKNIAMPLNPGLRMEVLNTEAISASTAQIQVLIYKEEGFDPSNNLDISSLRFGRFSTVNYGGGAEVVSHTTDAEGNLLLTFEGANTGLTADEFAPKLIGRYTASYTPPFPNASAGCFCFGYAKLPFYDYTPAYLSPVLPAIGEGSKVTAVKLYNAGLSASPAEGITVQVLTAGGILLASANVPTVAPYGIAEIALNGTRAIPSGQKTLIVKICKEGKVIDTHTLLLTDINALQSKLSALCNDAELLYSNEKYVNNREAMNTALQSAKTSVDSYSSDELNAAITSLTTAIEAFKAANPSIANVTCRNYYFKAANLSAGNTYMYVSSTGTLARKSSCDQSSVFTLIIDGDASRVYLYNPSAKAFVVAKAGNGSSFWSASTTNAFVLAEVSASSTTSGAYTLKGDPTSTNTYNYLNAYGGQNHTELCSYTQDNSGSQWLLVACPDQTYSFDVKAVTTGLKDFLITAKKIDGAVIDDGTTGIETIQAEEAEASGKSGTISLKYNLQGMLNVSHPSGLQILDNKIVLTK